MLIVEEIQPQLLDVVVEVKLCVQLSCSVHVTASIRRQSIRSFFPALPGRSGVRTVWLMGGWVGWVGWLVGWCVGGLFGWLLGAWVGAVGFERSCIFSYYI